MDQEEPHVLIDLKVEVTPKDQYCADRNTFVVENLCGLSRILVGER